MKAMFIAAMLLPMMASAQVGEAWKRLKKNTGSAVEEKAQNGINKKIDGILSKKPAADAPPAEEGAAAAETSTAAVKKEKGLKAYSRFDFVPGETVVYAEDFSKDALGEMPLHWTTKGRGEVMELEGLSGKWLRGYQGARLTSESKKELGDNYTVEFDLVYFFEPKEAVYVMPDLSVRMLNMYTVDYKNASGNVSDREGENSFTFNIHPHENSAAWVETYGERREDFRSDRVRVQPFASGYNQVQHYAIQVQKTRLRIWIDENKIFDLPQAINPAKKMSRIAFMLGSSSYQDSEVGFYVTNIRFANGLPDTRHKLLDEGKFSTTGILFAVNSAEIQPPSYSVIKEIAAVLKEHGDLKIRIIGHTSSDGKPDANLELSRRRAQAVKQQLEQEFGIAGNRMETDGKGDTLPVAPNTTQEGRVQNRRVEFIKQ